MGCVLSVQDIRTPLVPIHIRMCQAALFSHDHAGCEVCSVNARGCRKVQDDNQGLIDIKELVVTRKEESVCVVIPVLKSREQVEAKLNVAKPVRAPLVICLPGPSPYASQKVVPYKYEATILEDGKEVPLFTFPAVSNIAGGSQVLRSGRVLPTIVQGKDKAQETESIPMQVASKGKGAS